MGYTRGMKPTLFSLAIVILSAAIAGAQEPPVDLPPGFSITKLAGNELVPDASAMTVGPNGDPIVSGPGYVRQLIDSNDDSVFDSYETLAAPKGIAQGIWFDGESLWLTVDGAIQRSVSRSEGQPFVMEPVVSIKTGVEHGSHAIRKGPDGWWYVLCGNATDIEPSFYSLEESPVKDPRAGFLMRFPPTVKTGNEFAAEVYCHGFRNAYDFDFDSQGNLFVFDSDGERDVSLPWYRPTRIFRMVAGDDAGWVNQSWKRPASFFDMPELVGQLGRGSPTGVSVCDANSFGVSYTDAVFVGDWTFGRIGVAKLGHGVEIFAKAKGNFGFAVTDLEFAPSRGLFVTTGGRGTEGGLYLISAAANATDVLAGKKSPRDLKPAETIKVVRDELVFADRVSKLSTVAADSVAREVRTLQLMLGGCDGIGMFTGHRAKSPIKFSDSVAKQIGNDLTDALSREDAAFEVARLIGMLEIDHPELKNALAKIAAAEVDPVRRIHFLNCVAVAGGELDPEVASAIAAALLHIRREINAADLPVDRNWLPRMRELATKLFRDMRIAEAIVNDASFGQVSDLWLFESLPLFFHQTAAAKIVARVEADPENVTAGQLRFVVGSASQNPRYAKLLRSYSTRTEFTDILVKAFYNRPTLADFDLLLRGLGSFDFSVQKASLIGLRKIDAEALNADQKAKALKSMFQLESRLGWSNPEISIRDQFSLLLKNWSGDLASADAYSIRQYDLSGKKLQRQKEAIETWKLDVAKAFEISIEDPQSKPLDLESIDFSRGDIARGKSAFQKFLCASCHNGGGRNAGPSLAGISSRFSQEDIFRAIVDPNANVPDRYRAVKVATEDGQLFFGSVVYESKAGIMLATSSGEVVRIAAEEIADRRKSPRSLMPEGLLDHATDEEIADLWAYLQSLK